MATNFTESPELKGIDPIVEHLEILDREVSELRDSDVATNSRIDEVENKDLEQDSELNRHKLRLSDLDDRANDLDVRVNALDDRDMVYVSSFEASYDNDFDRIQAALDYCAAHHKSNLCIDARSTPYNIDPRKRTLPHSADYLRVPSNLHIWGYGAQLNWTGPAEGVTISNAGDGSTGKYQQNHDIIIEGLYFTQSDEAMKHTNILFHHSYDIQIINCRFFYHTQWHFIEICGCRNTTVSGCDFGGYTRSNNSSEMLQLDLPKDATNALFATPYDNTPCEYIKIINNYFHVSAAPTGSNKIAAIGSHTHVENKIHTNVVIEGNFFHWLDNAISTVSLKNSVISNNECDECGGFYRTTYADAFFRNIFDGNRINLITAKGGDYRAISLVTDAAESRAEGCVISNNVITGGPWHGIAINGSDHTVTGNYVEGAQSAGIYLYYAGGCTVSNNNLLNCSYATNKTAQAVQVVGARSSNTITGNHLGYSGDSTGVINSAGPNNGRNFIYGNTAQNITFRAGTDIVHVNYYNGSYQPGE